MRKWWRKRMKEAPDECVEKRDVVIGGEPATAESESAEVDDAR